MIVGDSTIGYSSTPSERLSGKTSLGASFSGHSSINHHRHTSGSSSAAATVVTSSSLPTSRMHLVDTLRESFMNSSYEKHVSFKSVTSKIALTYRCIKSEVIRLSLTQY